MMHERRPEISGALVILLTAASCTTTNPASPVAPVAPPPNIVIGAPQLTAPAAGAAVFDGRPTLVVQNASRTGPAGAISYEFQVSTSAAFTDLAASATVQEQAGQTS